MTGRSLTVRTFSPAETEDLGRALGRLLRPGDVVALTGELGAGKTVLTRGIAEGAGAGGYIASPTFTLIREYHGPVTVYHVDFYRLDVPSEMADLGLEDILDGGGIVVIEWAEKALALLPPEYLWIEIRFTEDDEGREITLAPRGDPSVHIVERLRGAREA